MVSLSQFCINEVGAGAYREEMHDDGERVNVWIAEMMVEMLGW